MAGLVKKAQGLQRFMLDCGFWRSRKWVGGGLAAIGLQTCGISYSYEHGTDGRLPKDDLALALGLREKEVKAALAVLLKRDIWREVDGVLEIVGYEDHNPSQAEVEEHRARQALSGQKGNHEKWHRTKPNPDCPFCKSGGESHLRSQPDPVGDRTSDRSRDPDPIANGSQPRSLSRVEESRVDPPPSPFSPTRADPPIGTAGLTDEEETSNDEPTTDEPLVERLATLWPNRARMLAECRVVVAQCLAVADAAVVDECIGAMLAVDDRPHSPKYLLHTVRNRLLSMGAYAPGDEALSDLGGRT